MKIAQIYHGSSYSGFSKNSSGLGTKNDLFHGSSYNGGTKYSSNLVHTHDTLYTISIATPYNLSVNSACNPETEGNDWAVNYMGHFIPFDCHIIGISSMVKEFVAFGASQVVWRFRHWPGDGSSTSPIAAPAGGVFVGDFTQNFPNSGGLTNNYKGDSNFSINWAVPAGRMLYAYILSGTVNTIYGVTMWIVIQKD